MSDDYCERCGAIGDMPHAWVEGDCVLPHRTHFTKLATGTHICQPCIDRWDDWLTETLELWAGLTDVLHAGSVPEAESEHQKPRKAPASPSPLRLMAWALANPKTLNPGNPGPDIPDIPTILTNWAEAIWDALDYGDGWPTTVSGATAAIRSHRDTIAAMPDVDTFDAELRWIRRALRTAHGINARSVGLCPTLDGWGKACGGKLWLAPNGTMAVNCARCGRHFDERFLSHLGGMMTA